MLPDPNHPVNTGIPAQHLNVVPLASFSLRSLSCTIGISCSLQRRIQLGFQQTCGGERCPRSWNNNYCRPGPATGESVNDRIFLQKGAGGRMHASENYMWNSTEVTSNHWIGVHFRPNGDETTRKRAS